MMPHIPHLYLPGGWEEAAIRIGDEQRHHLEKVLRIAPGEPVTYSDGQGRFGSGSYSPGVLTRGDERALPRPSDLVVVVAPPDNRERARFLIEKLAEIGVAEIRFLQTRHGQGRPPKVERLHSWAVSGMEQSRGAWLPKMAEGLVTFAHLDPPYVVCDQGGSEDPGSARTVVVGPEGGWAEGEIPDGVGRYHLGDTVLRVETAALVAAARMI